jgi:hypothetical protein
VSSAGSRRSSDAPAGRSASRSPTGGFDQEVAYDKATIADIQTGKVQLAKVNARAYDTVGVNSFQALLAPFLIDNPTLEQRVPESDLAGEMLVEISRLGLVGLAMLPTDLRNRRACRVRWWRSRTTGHPHRHSGRRGRQGDLHRLGATPSVSPRRTAPEARRSRTRSQRDQLERV